jgi:phosphatidylserine/phosphatidylglycerophosphate/cardiolipin synthase-like enzyme
MAGLRGPLAGILGCLGEERGREVRAANEAAKAWPVMRTNRPMLGILPLVAFVALRASDGVAQEVHFAPEERLDAIDASLIATAKRSLDLASYALTDPVVLDALNGAQRRGVAIRIVLDPRERHDFAKLGDLSDTVRIKRGGPFHAPEGIRDRRRGPSHGFGELQHQRGEHAGQ